MLQYSVMATQAEVQLSPYAAVDALNLARFAVQAYATTYSGRVLSEEELSHVVQTQGWVQEIEEMAQSDTIILARAQPSGDIVGYTQFGNADEEVQGKWPNARELRKLYVAHELQSRGIGSKLMDAALAHPVLAQADPLHLWVWGRNTRAINFYKNKYGFHEIARRHYVHGDQTMYDSLMVWGPRLK